MGVDAFSSALIAALDKVRPAVVHVYAVTPRTGQIALGTGVILDHYHVITTAQVVAPGDEITVKTADGKRRRAECVGLDPLYFLAILRLEERLPVDPPTFAPDGTTPVGLFVVAVGYALGMEHTATHGIISSSDRTVYRPKGRGRGNVPVDGLLLTSAAIHPGNTGGPLVDLEGRVVGINGIPWQGGVSLALQAAVAARVASQIIDHGYAVHPWLGFSGEPDVIDDIWVEMLNLPGNRGLVVQHVQPDGPGQRAGVEEMDMVMAVDGRQPVTSSGMIRKVLSSHRYGDRVPLTVLRQGELIELYLPVEEVPGLQTIGLGDDEESPLREDDDD
nr:trypsin-like peptidase domain-containing protein [Symbiobacterium terraclitae]